MADYTLTPGSSSSSLTTTSTSSSSSNLIGDEGRVCAYCTNLKLLREILPPKRCDYCRKWKCQFCTLKFPMLSGRKGLPRIMKGNTRICVQCFSHHWQENGLSTVSSNKKALRRNSIKTHSLPDIRESSSQTDLAATGAVRRSSFNADNNRRESMLIDSMWAGKESFDDSSRLSFMRPTEVDPPAAGNKPVLSATETAVPAKDARTRHMLSVMDVLLSLSAVAILLVIALADGFTLQQRVCYCIATYGLFLTLHPWVRGDHDSPQPPLAEPTSPTKVAASDTTTVDNDFEVEQSQAHTVPPEYKKQLETMKEVNAFYLSDQCPWKVVRKTNGGVVYEMTANTTPFPVFKIEVLISGISARKFLDFINSTAREHRTVWDLNMADFKVIEKYSDDDGNVSVCQNIQKSFLGGLVAPRDFCLLYLYKEDSISFSSVEHPNVPATSRAVRGTVFMSSFHCKEEQRLHGKSGFVLTYICHVDIGGSLPTKLLYNGTIDNMEKMVKVFKNAENLFVK